MDGASKVRTYFNIVLPLLKPILTTVVVLDTLATWNDIITNQLIVGGNAKAMNIQNALICSSPHRRQTGNMLCRYCDVHDP
ncbi:MAG: hypothetical protein ACLRMZ_17970 [Blautia marasmi]